LLQRVAGVRDDAALGTMHHTDVSNARRACTCSVEDS